jgi:hypothetical protein
MTQMMWKGTFLFFGLIEGHFQTNKISDFFNSLEGYGYFDQYKSYLVP